MNFVKQIERIQRLNKLISEENTGTPDELSSMLHISKRQLFNLLDSLKSMGVEIKYSRISSTYYYAGIQRIKIDFSFELIDEKCLKLVNGGKLNANFNECNFISPYSANLLVC